PCACEGASAPGHGEVLAWVGGAQAAAGDLTALELDRHGVVDLGPGLVDAGDRSRAGLGADASPGLVGEYVAEHRVVAGFEVSVTPLQRRYVDDVERAELNSEAQHVAPLGVALGA